MKFRVFDVDGNPVDTIVPVHRIMVLELADQDKENIANMPPGFHFYAMYPADVSADVVQGLLDQLVGRKDAG